VALPGVYWLGVLPVDEIRVTCKTADCLAYDQIELLQGRLKKRTDEQIDKICRSIIKHGWAFPEFIWQNEGHNYCLDGHGRQAAIPRLIEMGYTMPPIPVVYVEAKNKAEAKELLLKCISQYGSVTREGFEEFADFNFDFLDFEIPNISFSFIDIDDLFVDVEKTASQDNGESKYSVHMEEMKMKKAVIVTGKFLGRHCWPGANEECAHLKNPHTHIFTYQLVFPVERNNRQVEFETKRQEVLGHILGKFQKDIVAEMGEMSCEDICEFLLEKNPDAMQAECYEDSGGGAIVRR
jgi:hypothetical protein